MDTCSQISFRRLPLFGLFLILELVLADTVFAFVPTVQLQPFCPDCGQAGNALAACSRLLGYLEGGFGTLIGAASGFGAIIAASVGGFKAAWNLFVVSVGCFILRSFLPLFLTGC